MIKYILDIFCNDTIVGLCQIKGLYSNKLFKNNNNRLFEKYVNNNSCSRKFIDPIAYHL